jgi:23S rRNA (uridine2552-2'-O)-methyltransferase
MKLEQAKRDYYRRLARERGFRSRAAFKLQQINNKYHLIRKGSKVVDIGAAPGGWLQVASGLVGVTGLVVGIDLDPIENISKNTSTLQLDVASADLADRIIDNLYGAKADCILADLSPKLSGIWDIDEFKQIDLCMKVLDVAPEILKRGGAVVMKAFQGNELRSLIERAKAGFTRIEISKPNASRKESSEIYIVGLDFTGQAPREESEEPKSERSFEEHPDSALSDW